jgi:hypothetical protein
MKNFIIFILLCCLPSTLAWCQEFKFHSTSPFGIQVLLDSSDAALKYMFVDFDQDSDLDLVMIGYDSLDTVNPFSYKSFYYFIHYQENIGDKKHPAFAERRPLVEDFPFLPGLFFPTTGDLDGDGRVDLVVSAEIDEKDAQYLLYYHQRNDGTFDIMRMTELGLDPFFPKSFFVPELTDLDNDGDLDLLLAGYAPDILDPGDTLTVPTFLYAKNIGSRFTPEFLGWFENPFGLVADPKPTIPVAGDLNRDGHVDILAICEKDSVNGMYFYRNVPGSNGKPAFHQPVESPFGLPKPGPDESILFPSLADLDGDNDLDLFFIKIDEELFTMDLYYYENTMSTSGFKQDVDYSDKITVVPNPAREELTILNSTSLDIADVSIFSNSGKYIRTARENPQYPLAINDLPNGLYILRIRLSNGKEVIKKVVVMHN